MTYSPVLYYDAGQIATLVLETESSDGYAIDPINPVVEGIFKPDLTSLSGFPVPMSRLGNEVGIFIAQFQLPSGLTATGTYLCIVNWVDPQTSYQRQKVYSLVVGVPFGNASVVGM